MLARVRRRLMVLTLILAAFVVGCSRSQPTNPNPRKPGTVEDTLAAARETLARSNDLDSCRSAVQQLNNHLGRLAKDKQRELSADQRKLLEERLGLTADEIAETASGSLTLLDAHHLEMCLLLRDAARLFDTPDLTPADRAAAAFGWTVRQVRLRDGDGGPLPPQFVLRRGYGTALDRALVFLSLLPQLGLDGCMVALPGAAQDRPRYWVCGVLVRDGERKHILLFDPRLGMPLPGAKGQGTATLADVRSQPEVLHQLTTGEHRYDVSAEQAQAAELHVACTLSALAPRMKLVQDELLGPGLKVNLAVDLAALLGKFEDAAKDQGGKERPAVRTWRAATRALRTFLPPEEGGVDTNQLQQRMATDVIPRDGYPKALLALGQSSPGLRLRESFVRPFVDFAFETRMPREEHLKGRYIYLGTPANPEAALMPFEKVGDGKGDGGPGSSDKQLTVAAKVGTETGKGGQRDEALDRARMPRDLLLRGRLDEAAPLLVSMQGQLSRQKDRLAALPDLDRRLAAWTSEMVNAYGAFLQSKAPDAQARMEMIWRKGDRLFSAALEGAAADPLLAEVVYQLALCAHERAEQFQVNFDRLGDKERGKLIAERGEMWRNAAHWWDTYLADHASRPAAAAARRWRAQTYAALGDREAAVNLLQNLSGELTALEKVARLYQARRLKTP